VFFSLSAAPLGLSDFPSLEFFFTFSVGSSPFCCLPGSYLALFLGPHLSLLSCFLLPSSNPPLDERSFFFFFFGPPVRDGPPPDPFPPFFSALFSFPGPCPRTPLLVPP